MDKLELEKRTKQFAIRIIKFAATLPYGRIAEVVRYQLVKAGTSVGANYREANRAESRNDFIHKVSIVEKEASEASIGWRFAKKFSGVILGNGSGCYVKQGSCQQSSQVREELLKRHAHRIRNSKFAIRNPKAEICQ